MDADQTREFTVNFTDPDNDTVRVASVGVVPPIASTDFHLGTSTEGTDDTLTSNLGTPIFEFGVNAGSCSFTNSGTVDGYLWMQVQGTAVYLYDAVEYKAEDTDSQAEHGLVTMNIDMAYQDDPTQAETIGNFLILDALSPQQEMESYPFYANRDDEHMMAFVMLEIGDRIHPSESQSGFDRDCYINGISFEQHPNNIVKCTYRTRFVSSLTGWQLGIEGYSELGETTILG